VPRFLDPGGPHEIARDPHPAIDARQRLAVGSTLDGEIGQPGTVARAGTENGAVDRSPEQRADVAAERAAERAADGPED
jgi:hypothetical protein